MGKMRPLFPQGASYNFGIGALSEAPRGRSKVLTPWGFQCLFQAPHTMGVPTGTSVGKGQRQQKGDWECDRILLLLKRVGSSLEDAEPYLGPFSGLYP